MIAQFRQWLMDHYDSMSEMGIIQVGTYENKLPDNQLVSLVITHETAKKSVKSQSVRIDIWILKLYLRSPMNWNIICILWHTILLIFLCYFNLISTI